jgi:hypothetical protein
MSEYPYPFNKLFQVIEIFKEKRETVIESKIGTFRRAEWILPDTVFFTYGKGVRSCFVREGLNVTNALGCYIQVFYGTIDDASMCYWIYLEGPEQMNKAYDVLSKVLHLDDRDNPVGLSYYNNTCKDVIPRDMIFFEEAVKELLDTHLRPICSYYVEFDYN